MIETKPCNHLGLGRRCWGKRQAPTRPGTVSMSARTFGFQNNSNILPSGLTGMPDPCTKKLCNQALYNESAARRKQGPPHLGHPTLMSLIPSALHLPFTAYTPQCTQEMCPLTVLGHQLFQEVSGWIVGLQGTIVYVQWSLIQSFVTFFL